MAVKPVVHDDTTNKHRPLGSGEKMDGLSASSIISSQSGNLITTGSDGLAYATGSGIADPSADNLLEATPSGKLKMDVDRLAEWLDGHPADAKALSEAIKVVSGDSGNVISKGSDKGAYLSAASLADIISGMSASQLQQLASALADGKTIVASGGKLTVDPTSATAAQLNKISSAIRKSGGGLSVGSDGKLSVDFASMSASTLSDLIAAIIKDGGGLAVDGNGQIYVDFDTMPTDEFENMLKSLKMQVPLDRDLHVFVDAENGSDGAERTKTTSGGVDVVSPDFKTIGAAVSYVTRTYALGAFNATIYVKPGTYSLKNAIALPRFDATSGHITISAYDFSSRPLVTNDISTNPAPYAIFNQGGGTWYLDGLRIVDSVSDPAASTPTFCYGIVAGGNGEVYLRNISLTMSYTGGAPSVQPVYMTALQIGVGSLMSVLVSPNGPTSVEVHKGNATSLGMFNVAGTFYFRRDNMEIAGDNHKLLLSGEATTVFTVGGGRVGWTSGGLNKTVMAIPSGSDLTGQAYRITASGSMYMASDSPVPGTSVSAGYVESESYSWYAINPTA